MLPALADQRQVRRLVCGPQTQHELAVVLSRLAPDSSIGTIGLTRCTYKPGRTLRAYYDISVRGAPWPVSVTWRATAPSPGDGTPGHGAGDADLIPDSERAALDSMGNAPFRSLAGRSEALGASVLVWPFDPDMSHLAPTVQHWRRQGGDVEVIRYRPGQRHVLRVGRRRAGTLYVKLSAERDRTGLDPTTLVALVDAVGTERAESPRSSLVGPVDVSMPVPGAVAYPEAAGVPLTLDRGSTSLRAALPLLARLAARLHRTEGATHLPVTSRTLSEELALVERAAEHVVALAPELAATIEEVLASVGDVLGSDGTHGLIHGDLKLDHVFTSADGIELIDIDGMRLADPATDLAKLLAELRFLAVDSGRRELTEAADAFLAHYRRYGSSDTVHRASWLEPALLVKMAARRVSLADPSWGPRVSAIVEVARRLGRGVEAGVPS